MKLGIVLGYSGADMTLPIEQVLEAERLGFDSVWSSEAYGSDAVTPAAWVLARTTRIKVGTAIMQMPARTPAMAAMTAMTLDALSGGRFILGIGPSGPQVVEGWHGVAYGKPLLRTREYIEIIRKILDRSEPLTYSGEHYQIPYVGPGATGLGKT
jgi:alkanesulfonate monooxygenase SsuD/methylene tetrahydromethanopterin reductase-like flavin-dependent oxidoreductase (luciferase family)